MHFSKQIGILYSLQDALDWVNFRFIFYIKLGEYSRIC